VAAARLRRRSIVAVLALLPLTAGVLVSAPSASAAPSTPLAVGLNADGQLGDGTTTNRTTPVAVRVDDAVGIASGREHAYALDSTGRIRAWGDGSRGAIGDGTTADRPTPVTLGLTGVVEVEAGHYHGIALRSDGTVWTWGYNGLGQLGLGDTTTRLAPTQVAGLTGVVAVAAGRDMSYALLADGTVRAWGSNAGGEVGDGTTTRRLRPTPVVGLSGVVELAGGRNHGVARRADGSVWAWGANEFGQVGDGTTATRTLPVRVITAGARHIDTGAEHSLAVLDDGTVRSWGRGWRGQLGLGTTSNRTTPTPVPGLPAVVEVGDGRDQSFALTASGDVWAWGHNDSGQLGDGTTTDRTSPVKLALTGIASAQGGRAMTVFRPAGAVGPGPDTTPPSAPGRPAGTSTVAGQVALTWAAATDDRATTLTYQVFRDGGATPVGQLTGPATGTVSFTDAALTPGSVHTWTVRASDGTNWGPPSAASDPVTVAGGGGPTVLASSDFAAGFAGWTGVSGLVVDTATGSPADAPPSARAQVTNAPSTARLALSRPAASTCSELDVRLTSVGGTARYAVLKLRNTAGASIGRVWVDGAGRLSVRADVTGAQFATPAVLQPGTWRRVGLCVTVGTAGALQLRVDGAAVGTWTVDTGRADHGSLQLGDNDPRTATLHFDRVVVTAGG
jgi:alpha-tubulin suppressor-like RCC1 family protein